MRAHLVPIILVATGVIACIPMRVPVRRDYVGMVVDDATSRPISGATVVIESWQVPTPPGYSHSRTLAHSFETKTDADGRWRVPGEKDWKLGILAADGFPFFTDTFCVTATGYEAVTTNPWAGEPASPSPDGSVLAKARPPQKVALRRSELSQSGFVRTEGNESSRCGIPVRPKSP
jgi:hypothetical protein